MMNARGGAIARAVGIVALMMIGAQQARAQQTASWVESELQDDESGDTLDRDVQLTTSAGAGVATALGGGDTRALTDFGVNKVRASGSGAYGQSAASVWLDSYTVGGEAGTMVDLSFTVSVDGLVNVTGDDHSWNYKLFAVRGEGWSTSGYQDFDSWPQDTPTNYYHTGDNYDRVFLNQLRPDGGVTQMDARDFSGFNNYAPNSGGVGTFASNVTYDEASDTYIRTVISGFDTTVQHFGPTGYRQSVNGGAWTPLIPYFASPPLAQGRANLVANYSMLGYGELCFGQDNECANQLFPGNEVTVSFSALAGSTFSLAGYMFADDVYDGTIDFFNTAKLTGISVSQGGSLNSASGSLVDLGNGRYGYEAVLAGGVPEPSTWAMLILGFGIVGGALRRQTAAAFRKRASLHLA